jgi:hypothetical protein
VNALRLFSLFLVVLSGASGGDQPLQLPAWLTPFPHGNDDQTAAASGHLHTSYDAGASFGVVVGHYEDVLRSAAHAGVTYREGGDANGATFRASQNQTSCSVQINTEAHVDVDCVVNPTVQAASATAPDASATSARPVNRSAGPRSPADLLQRTIRFSVLGKGFIPSDASARRFQALLTLNCSYQNTSETDVRAFTGTVLFQDLFGREIFKVRVTISDSIPSGQAAAWNGTVDYNQFIESHRHFLETRLEDMKVVWLPSSIIFSDGTQIGEPR